MITYNSDNARIFIVPPQYGVSSPSLQEVQSYSFGGYGTGISSVGVQQSDWNGQGGDRQMFPGVFVKTADKTWGVLLGNEFQPQVYRGQNKDHPTFASSYSRIENDLDKLLAQIQREEFRQFFMQSPYYKRCRDFVILDCKYEFDFEAIFQHYGFKSSYVDITKELFVALFFAYTYIGDDGKYYPISDFKEYNPTLYVTLISEIDKGKCVSPISLQMVGRPIRQMAMALNAQNNDLKPYFQKYELPKDPFIAIDVYEKFQHGNTLFPIEPIAEIAKQILSAKEINSEIAQQICSKNSFKEDKFFAKLKNHGYLLSDIKWNVDEQMRVQINDEIDRYLLPLLEQIRLRRTSLAARS